MGRVRFWVRVTIWGYGWGVTVKGRVRVGVRNRVRISIRVRAKVGVRVRVKVKG